MATSTDLRTAQRDDLEDIAELFLACWQTSYRDVLPPALVAMYGPSEARALWQRSFERGAGERRVVVADDVEHGIVGVVVTGREPGHADTGHIFSLYVDPEAQGLGIGSRLMAAAIERFAAEGLSRASLWVFAANRHALEFYERFGWLPDGTERVEPEYNEPELRLARSLAL